MTLDQLVDVLRQYQPAAGDLPVVIGSDGDAYKIKSVWFSAGQQRTTIADTHFVYDGPAEDAPDEWPAYEAAKADFLHAMAPGDRAVADLVRAVLSAPDPEARV